MLYVDKRLDVTRAGAKDLLVGSSTNAPLGTVTLKLEFSV